MLKLGFLLLHPGLQMLRLLPGPLQLLLQFLTGLGRLLGTGLQILQNVFPVKAAKGRAAERMIHECAPLSRHRAQRGTMTDFLIFYHTLSAITIFSAQTPKPSPLPALHRLFLPLPLPENGRFH